MTSVSSILGRTTNVAAYVLCLAGPRVLLARRGGSDRTVWNLPGGGLVFGEDPAEAARREVLVGTGLVVSLGPVLGIDSLRISTPSAIRGRASQETHALRVVYAGTVVGGLAPGPGNPAHRFEWVAVEALLHRPRAELVDTAVGWARSDAGESVHGVLPR